MSKLKTLAAIGILIALIAGVGVVMGQQTSACVTGGAVASGNPDLATDCDALLGMKSALRGSAKLNWWSGRPIEQWDGITADGRVVGLSLPNKGLDGHIPDDMGNLVGLKTLVLSYNSLIGDLPDSLNDLTNLTRWRLAGNQFTGCLPVNMARVPDTDTAELGLPVCSGGPVPTATPTATPPSVGPTPTPAPPRATPTLAPSSDRLGAIEGRLSDVEARLATLEVNVAQLMATPTPTPTPIPGLGTQQSPVPFGTTFTFLNSVTDHWEFTVLEATPDATTEILNHNRFNDPPASGNQFYMVKVRAKYLGTGSQTFRDTRLKTLGDSGVVYAGFDTWCGLIPNSLPEPELFTNGQVEGNECWEVASADADSLVLFVEPRSSFSFSGTRFWFSLTP